MPTPELQVAHVNRWGLLNYSLWLTTVHLGIGLRLTPGSARPWLTGATERYP